MRAGLLDRRLTLQRATVADDGFTTSVTGWDDLAVVWGSKTDLSVAETLRAPQIGATVTTRFQIRWSSAWSDLNAKDRLSCDGLTYAIVGVQEIQRRRGLTITACALADAPATAPAP